MLCSLIPNSCHRPPMEAGVHGPSDIAQRMASFAQRSDHGFLKWGAPDWRDSSAYEWLREADPMFFAWEWLRRDPEYRKEALARHSQATGKQSPLILEQPEAAKWGLHAFEDPRRSSAARPLWLASHDRSVLRSSAVKACDELDSFSLEKIQAVATVGLAGQECRLLLCEGAHAVRIDVDGHQILTSPVHLQFRICGFEMARQSVRTWERLKQLMRRESLPPLLWRGFQARQRQLLLLRTFDALEAGATQRQIAAELIRTEAAIARWRAINPSLRSQAQRMVKGARLCAQGRFWSFLE